MGHYKKHKKSEEVEIHVVPAEHVHEVEKHLEPTVAEEPHKTMPEKMLSADITKHDEKVEEVPTKEMHAEIASVSVDLAKKVPTEELSKENPSIMVPIAIIIAGILVAGSILYTGSQTPAAPKSPEYQGVAAQLKKPTIAEEVGLDKKAFQKCLASGKYADTVAKDLDEGIKAGIQGTPYSLIITKDGKKVLINGAEPIDMVKSKIEAALAGTAKYTAEGEGNIPPITDKDHIFGNRNADLLIVEYSDPECPFCKRFDATMNQVMDQYQASNKVAWVYRHFPLDSIHPKSRHESEALECANEIGGNAKFWEYVKVLFKVTPGNDGLDPTLL
jgi:protein-disulfide isomerase